MDNKLELFAKSLFTNHETRMYRKEKDTFLAHCQNEFRQLGYDDVVIKEDRNMFGMTSKNLVVGPVDADILITAHYDTPSKTGFLLMFTPLLGAVLGNILFMFIIMFLPQVLNVSVAIASDTPWVSYLTSALALMILVSFFLKNRHNHNDNTSGVVGVYQIAQLVAKNPELKARCAFILFDHEEVMPGLLGSKAFAKWRRENHPDKINGTVINLDCIGIGDKLEVMTKKEHEIFHDIAKFLQEEGFDVQKARGGLSGNSDHASFPNGVSLLYKKRSLLGPTYIPKIHTRRDTTCDLDQVERLCEAVYRYIDRASV